MYSRFSFCNSFPREASDDLTQPMKVNALERAFVEAFSNKFRSRTTAQQCAQMSVSVSTQCGRGNQELSSQTAQCVSQEFLMSQFPIFLNNYLEVSQSGKRFVGVLVAVTDLFQNSAENGMFGHSTRNSLDLVATICRFLHDDSYCNMITRYGPLSKVVRNMRIAMKITRLSHKYINDRPVDSG